MKLVEKIKFKLTGKSVPVVKVSDIGEDGRVCTLQMVGDVKDRPNSLVDAYNVNGWEKEQGTQMIQVIDQKGIKTMAWIASEAGRTVNLFVHPYFKDAAPNREDIIGAAATMDDIAEAMDLGKSMRNLLIGLFIGIGLGMFILGPMLSAAMG